MNKKIFLFFVLSLINNNLLYGDNTEKIIRKNDCSRWDRYLGMTAAMTQVPVPTAT